MKRFLTCMIIEGELYTGPNILARDWWAAQIVAEFLGAWVIARVVDRSLMES